MSRDAGALFVKCILLAVVATLPVAFSAWADPARLLGAHAAESAIANAMVAGHHVADVMNYDERAIGVLLARRRAQRPDVLALGSSRIQALDQSDFPGLVFVNAGVSSGRLDDVLGLYEPYDDEAHRPSRLILNLDPLSLDEDPVEGNWNAIANERATMMARIGAGNHASRDLLGLRLAMLERLASPEYFRLAVHSFRRYGARGMPFVVTDVVPLEGKTKAPNGTVIWGTATTAQTNAAVGVYLADLARIERMHEQITPEVRARRGELLLRFLEYVQRTGVRVTLVLVPYHPDVYAAYSLRRAQTIPLAERTYRELARRANVEIIGSYDPAVAGVTAADVLDQEHLTHEALARVVGAGRP